MKLALVLFCAWTAAAQTKPAITPADMAKWEALGAAALSPDGKWLAHTITRGNGTSELRISDTATAKAKVAAFGKEPAFSADSRWAAYAVGVSEAEEDKLKKARKPVQNKLGILDLGAGTVSSVDDVASFAFSDEGARTAVATRRPDRPGRPRPTRRPIPSEPL